MNRTGISKKNQSSAEYFGNVGMNQTGISNSNTSSLKNTLNRLDEDVNRIAKETREHRKEVSLLRSEKDELNDMLRFKTEDVKSILLEELMKVYDDMKRHFAHQKSENSRLDQQITLLKNERIVLKNQLNAIDRRITDLEMQVGNDDIKYT